MDRTCKHTFRPGCEDLEGRQLLSSAGGVLSVAATPSSTHTQIVIILKTLKPGQSLQQLDPEPAPW